jgi:hypothetical protein
MQRFSQTTSPLKCTVPPLTVVVSARAAAELRDRADRTTIASVLIFMLFSFKQCRYYEPKLAVVVPSRHSMYQPNGSTAGSAQFSPN